MRVGVPREIKPNESRVGLTPASVRELIGSGSVVGIEAGAGQGIGAADEAYRAIGAEVFDTPEALFDWAELIVKVKEPQPEECARLRPGQILFTYLHLAADPTQAKALIESGATAIAYETVIDSRGRLPLLAPMSRVAGRLSIQAGARCLEQAAGGSGLLLGGVPGVAPARVVVIGGGVVGTEAIRMALGLEADVTLLDTSEERLAELDDRFSGRLRTVSSNRDALERYVSEADLVIGAVLLPGAAAPKLVSRSLVQAMRPGSAVVDVAIDQGGCMETSRPTTHADPIYREEDVVHYCVANMPGGVPKTSSAALNHATLPAVRAIALNGLRALEHDAGLRAGLNIHDGQITHAAVGEALQLPVSDPAAALAA